MTAVGWGLWVGDEAACLYTVNVRRRYCGIIGVNPHRPCTAGASEVRAVKPSLL